MKTNEASAPDKQAMGIATFAEIVMTRGQRESKHKGQ